MDHGPLLFYWLTQCLQLLKLASNILRIWVLDVLTAESPFSRGTAHKGWLTDCNMGTSLPHSPSPPMVPYTEAEC